MTRSHEQLLTTSEVAFISGVPSRRVYKIARERLPRALRVRRRGQMLFRQVAAVCIRIDRDLPKDVPVKVRRAFYSALTNDARHRTLAQTIGALSYVLDASAAEAAVADELASYREAMRLVREDPLVQGGAAVFVGTRILVHTIADLLASGASSEELCEDYPNLSAAMLAAATVYARSHPRRGRPRAPRWRSATPDAPTAA